MINLTDKPLLLFVATFFVLWFSALAGVSLLRRKRPLEGSVRDDFGVVLAATLTLLGLILGFSFSMAISRYDQRKNLEEEEANAIGTEYLRADLMSAGDATKVKSLLKQYLEQRMAFYATRDSEAARQVSARTAQLQADLWTAVAVPAAAQPTPVAALTVAGMNDVLNSQGYTQAAWWNRIPVTAWGLMLTIAICGNLLIGYGAQNARAEAFLLPVLPLVVSITFMLIADIDSPRGGFIRVHPHNLTNLLDSLRAP